MGNTEDVLSAKFDTLKRMLEDQQKHFDKQVDVLQKIIENQNQTITDSKLMKKDVDFLLAWVDAKNKSWDQYLFFLITVVISAIVTKLSSSIKFD